MQNVFRYVVYRSESPDETMLNPDLFKPLYLQKTGLAETLNMTLEKFLKSVQKKLQNNVPYSFAKNGKRLAENDVLIVSELQSENYREPLKEKAEYIFRFTQNGFQEIDANQCVKPFKTYLDLAACLDWCPTCLSEYALSKEEMKDGLKEVHCPECGTTVIPCALCSKSECDDECDLSSTIHYIEFKNEEKDVCSV